MPFKFLTKCVRRMSELLVLSVRGSPGSDGVAPIEELWRYRVCPWLASPPRRATLPYRRNFDGAFWQTVAQRERRGWKIRGKQKRQRGVDRSWDHIQIARRGFPYDSSGMQVWDSPAMTSYPGMRMDKYIGGPCWLAGCPPARSPLLLHDKNATHCNPLECS